MSRFLLFAAAMIAALQLWAGPVDLTSAQETAQRFVQEKSYNGRLRSPLSGRLTLAHTEMNSQTWDRAVFYVFNTTNGFVIVSGDDRAEPILGYGDTPMDFNALPCNVKAWLATYKEQIEYLQAHEELQVETPSMMAPSLRTASVAPLLTALWDQEAPYWNQCKINNVQCLTGCPATSAAMVFHYWKYPDFETPEVPAYDCELSTSGWGGATMVHVAALPPVTFDWDNMLDSYTSGYNTTQANAVATLMRYIGQAERMAYGNSAAGGSGVDADSVILIANAFKFFGYDEESVRVVKKTSSYSGGTTLYSDAEWAALIQEELSEGRPIVFCAIAGGFFGGGHAFNVDGYDSSTNKYHINFGWSGSSNNYYALNAFNGGGSTFNQYQQMVIGIQPASKYPRLKVSEKSLAMECFKGQAVTSTFTLKGTNLESDATLTLNDPAGVFELNETTLPMGESQDGKTYTVTYTPKAAGTYTATITCSATGAQDVEITLTGNSPYELYRPELLPVDEAHITATSFRADWTDQTPAENVTSYTIEVMPEGDVLLLTAADFSNVPDETANHASDAQNYLPDNWTFTGKRLYLDGGFISPGRDCIITANCNMGAYEKVSVIITAKNYPSGTNTTIDVAVGDVTKRITLAPEVDSYLLVFDCDGENQVKIISGYYPEIQSIKIYGGEIIDPAPYVLRAPALRDGLETYLYEGIAPDVTSYNVGGLTPGVTYFYHIKAYYVNGTESQWSSVQKVSLPDLTVQRGDIDRDGFITIGDATILIDYILAHESDDEIDLAIADCDNSGSIGVGDVTALIDLLLQGE